MSPCSHVHPPPRALCTSNGVDLALSPDCPKELYPGHELTAAVLPPCWKIADNICWSRCSREIQFSSPSRSAPHLTLRDRRVRLSSRGIYRRCVGKRLRRSWPSAPNVVGGKVSDLVSSRTGWRCCYSTQCGSGDHPLSPASEEGPAISPLLSPDMELGLGKTLKL